MCCIIFIWGHASVSDVSMFDCGECIFSYPIDDEVLRSCAHTVEYFEGGYFPLLIHFFDHSYCCCCISCGGIVGVYVDRWIVHPRVAVGDGTVLLHRDYYGEVSIGVSFLEVVRLYAL